MVFRKRRMMQIISRAMPSKEDFQFEKILFFISFRLRLN
jgi:hypothetical protein